MPCEMGVCFGRTSVERALGQERKGNKRARRQARCGSSAGETASALKQMQRSARGSFPSVHCTLFFLSSIASARRGFPGRFLYVNRRKQGLVQHRYRIQHIKALGRSSSTVRLEPGSRVASLLALHLGGTRHIDSHRHLPHYRVAC